MSRSDSDMTFNALSQTNRFVKNLEGKYFHRIGLGDTTIPTVT